MAEVAVLADFRFSERLVAVAVAAMVVVKGSLRRSAEGTEEGAEGQGQLWGHL